jgi:hypothetical protein
VQLKLAKYFHEFATYIRANAHLIPNYGERYRCGEAISSAIAESTVNQVVSKRTCKSSRCAGYQRAPNSSSRSVPPS